MFLYTREEEIYSFSNTLYYQEITDKDEINHTMLQKSTASPFFGLTHKPFTVFPPQLHSASPALTISKTSKQ
jgi:hypothetical protein